MMSIKSGILTAALLATGAMPVASAFAAPYTFAVEVKTNFGTKFPDCFTFDGNGVLVVAGLGTLIYTAAPTDPKHYYTAVTTVNTINSVGDVIAFSGYKTGTKTDGTLKGVGSDIFGDSYVVKGVTTSSCSTSSQNGKNWVPPAH